MIFVLDLNDRELQGFDEHIIKTIEGAKARVLAAMRDRFEAIVKSNFGIMGPDRPWSWEMLAESTKQNYRKRNPPVLREYASLELTGAMKNAIMKGGVEGGSTTVSLSNADVPYATAHHYGTKNLPARRVFPVDIDDEVLPWTQSEVLAAARDELRDALS